MNKIHIIIPAYNEQGNITKLLIDLYNLELSGHKKIIVVDDGSTDKTNQLARQFQDKLDLQVITHPKNLGVPQTFFDGLAVAASKAGDNDIIFIIEGDNTSDLKVMPQMINKISSGADIVVASRYIKGGAYKNFPFYRTLASQIINLVIKIFFHLPGITDYTIFYRAYKAQLIKQALVKHGHNFITTKSFTANLEILWKARKFGKKFDEVPLIYDYGLKKGKSKMNLFKTLLEYQNLIFKRLLGKI